MARLPSASSSCCAVAYGSRVDTVVGYALLAIVAHALIGNRAHMREFRSILRDVRKLRDWMAERSEFELPVPVSKLSDDSVVL